jgi:hypothetical protein
VLAALVILGSMLVGVVLAKSRHTRQMAATQRLAVAVRAADELIAAWWASPGGVPIGRAGLVAGDPSLIWETRLARNTEIEKLGARVVRVEVREAVPQSVTKGDDQPLVAVELVVDDPARPKAKSATSAPTSAPATAPAGVGFSRQGITPVQEMPGQGGPS